MTLGMALNSTKNLGKVQRFSKTLTETINPVSLRDYIIPADTLGIALNMTETLQNALSNTESLVMAIRSQKALSRASGSLKTWGTS